MTRRRSLIAALRRLIAKRKAGKISPEQFAERKLVLTKCQYLVPIKRKAS